MGLLPSSNRISTTVWLHHLDLNEMLGVKAKQELHKDAACYFEEILKEALYQKKPKKKPYDHLQDMLGTAKERTNS